MGKNVLVVSASLRPTSNSHAPARAYARGAGEAGRSRGTVNQRGKRIEFCRGRLACQAGAACPLKDDAAAIVERIVAADAIAFATPIYFFEMAGQVAHPGGADVAGVPALYLVSISLGAVLCGAITYIGNGPNFMVKSVAESDGVPMPSFGRYIGYAFTLLVPVLAAMAMIFVGESWLVRGLGIALAAGLVFLSLVRIRRAGLDEAVADFSGNE